jgi:hypothetical protein
MAAAEELSDYLKKAAGDFPLTPATLYWRVYMVAERHLKTKTTVHSKYHANISKFFAILWRYFFEHKNIDPEKGHFNFPFEPSVITASQLASLNSGIDSEMRLFMNMQEETDQPARIANIMRMGDIGLKVKKIIVNHPDAWIGPDPALNDNRDAILADSILPNGR